MRKTVVFVLLTNILFTGIVSCVKEKSCEGCRKDNKPPLANAGADQAIMVPTDSVLLDGSASNDPDGKINDWLWTKISGPASFLINNATTAKTAIKNLSAGSYQFELKVTDDGGLSARDTMKVVVNPAATVNHSPTADAGPDQTIFLPTNTANLDGSASTDPDNNITGYTWTKISGPSSFSITNSNTAQTQVTNLAAGTYWFELKVTDAGGLFDKDTVQVEVQSAQLNNYNVFFFFRDTTGGLDRDGVRAVESFSPRIVLVRVRIANYPDAEIEGFWCKKCGAPICPIASNYVDETAYGRFNLPPGTYSWTAESVTTDLTSYPVPSSFLQYWMTSSHKAQGTITVQPGNNCMITEIVF
jgi:hypothetical protein